MLRMATTTRRDLCTALASFVALAAASDPLASAQLPRNNPVPAAPGSAGDPALIHAEVFQFSQLPVATSANGETRAVIRGVLPTGEAIEMHETTLLPGHMPHPAHQHRHSEFMMIREGTLECMFAASGVMHGLKNAGDAPANYFVISIGRDT
jgi:hypothetical protein